MIQVNAQGRISDLALCVDLIFRYTAREKYGIIYHEKNTCSLVCTVRFLTSPTTILTLLNSAESHIL